MIFTLVKMVRKRHKEEVWNGQEQYRQIEQNLKDNSITADLKIKLLKCLVWPVVYTSARLEQRRSNRDLVPKKTAEDQMEF